MSQVRENPEGALRAHCAAGVLRLVFNRPAARNAFNNDLLTQLADALQAASRDPQVRCIVLEGEGGVAFSAGIDLVERRGLSVPRMGEQSRAVLDLVRRVALSDQPVLACIDGWCLGAGLELALACDIRIATPESQFGFPEMMLGTYPGGGGAVMLPRVVGQAGALQILLAAERLGADAALQAGLLTSVVPRGVLQGTVERRAAQIAALSPSAVRALKTSMRGSMALPLEEAFALDQQLRRPLDASRDHEEGLLAFAARRQPMFTGE